MRIKRNNHSSIQGFLLTELLTNITIIMIISLFIAIFIKSMSNDIYLYRKSNELYSEKITIKQLLNRNIFKDREIELFFIEVNTNGWIIYSNDEEVLITYLSNEKQIVTTTVYNLKWITDIKVKLYGECLVFDLFYENASERVILGGIGIYEERSNTEN